MESCNIPRADILKSVCFAHVGRSYVVMPTSVVDLSRGGWFNHLLVTDSTYYLGKLLELTSNNLIIPFICVGLRAFHFPENTLRG